MGNAYLNISFCGETESFINITFNNSRNNDIFTKNINFKMMEPKFIGKAKLTKQGQLTMPQEARKDLKISAESEVYWYELNGALLVVKDIMSPSDIISFMLKKRKK